MRWRQSVVGLVTPRRGLSVGRTLVPSLTRSAESLHISRVLEIVESVRISRRSAAVRRPLPLNRDLAGAVRRRENQDIVVTTNHSRRCSRAPPTGTPGRESRRASADMLRLRTPWLSDDDAAGGMQRRGDAVPATVPTPAKFSVAEPPHRLERIAASNQYRRAGGPRRVIAMSMRQV